VLDRRLPVLSGLVAASAADGTAAARRAEELGAAGLQVFPPGGVEPARAVAYYEALGAASSLPLVVYQPPPALGAGLDVELLRQVLAVDAVVGVKESSWDRRRFAESARLCRQAKPAAVLLSGADTFILESLRMGADGAMLAVAAIDPHFYVDLFRLRETARAEALQHALDPFLGLLLAPPVGDFRARLKEVLRLDGVIRSSAVRPPLRPLASAEIRRLARALERAREAAAGRPTAPGPSFAPNLDALRRP
jgi:4-hydroxy-tetrahydrodipicolinate synthase